MANFDLKGIQKNSVWANLPASTQSTEESPQAKSTSSVLKSVMGALSKSFRSAKSRLAEIIVPAKIQIGVNNTDQQLNKLNNLQKDITQLKREHHELKKNEPTSLEKASTSSAAVHEKRKEWTAASKEAAANHTSSKTQDAALHSFNPQRPSAGHAAPAQAARTIETLSEPVDGKAGLDQNLNAIASGDIERKSKKFHLLAKELAFDLTSVSSADFRRIGADEFTSKPSGNYLLAATHSSQITQYVIKQIKDQKDPQSKANLVAFFLKLQQYMIDPHNAVLDFNSYYSIGMGIAAHKLDPALFNESDKKRFKTNNQLMDFREVNKMKIFVAKHARSKPAVPILSIIARDITTFQELEKMSEKQKEQSPLNSMVETLTEQQKQLAAHSQPRTMHFKMSAIFENKTLVDTKKTQKEMIEKYKKVGVTPNKTQKS
jgi:hypothetical protein